MKPDRITFLINDEPYASYEEAVNALNRYAEANAFLDGEPVLGRYYTSEGTIETILAICTVISNEETGCPETETLTYFISKEELNKDLAKVAFTGLYNDLDGKPIINGVELKNELTLSELGFKKVSWTGEYSDLYNTPTKVSEFENDAGYLTNASIENKADKVENAINGDIAGLDSDGNITDTGILKDSVLDTIDKAHTHENKSILDEIPSYLGTPSQTLVINNQGNGIEWSTISVPSGSGSVPSSFPSPTTYVTKVTLDSDFNLTGSVSNTDEAINGESNGIPSSQAVRNFVNSSINNLAAYYITKNAVGDPFDSRSELMSATTFYSGGVIRNPVTLNDYTIVLHDESQAFDIGSFNTIEAYVGYWVLYNSTYTEVTQENKNYLGIIPQTTSAYELPTTRYLNTSQTETPSWSFQYIVNNSGLTASQVEAINSGITSQKVSDYNTHVSNTTIHVTSSDKTNWNSKLNPVNIVTDDTSKNYVTKVTQDTNGQISVEKGNLSSVAVSGSYDDLTDKPIIPSAPGSLVTDNSVAQTPSSGESMSEIINLHKIAKTGTYSDLIGKPTIPDISGKADKVLGATNGDLASLDSNGNLIDSGISATSVSLAVTNSHTHSNKTVLDDIPNSLGTDGQVLAVNSTETSLEFKSLSSVAVSGSYDDLTDKPIIPSAPGNLNTTASTSQSIQSSESLSGSITLHKVSKTGSYSDLIGTPNLATVATSGSYSDLSNKPTIPTTAVLYTVQTLTTEQQAQARANIGAGSSGFSGDYTDLTNKPILKTDNTTAQSTSASETINGTINLHKVSKTGTYSDLIGTPSLATVATSGSYNDLIDKPSIPAAQVNSDWNASSGVSEILNKPNLAAVATSGSYNDLTNQPAIPNIPAQTGQSGKFLTTDGTDMSWATVSAGSSTLSDLTDTTITTPTDGQVLTYDNNTSKWVNAAPTGGSSITMRVWTNS